MPIQILMPALSPTMTEGNLAKWHKKEGDEVATGDVLAEIETDKATMEIEAVDDGTLGRILIAEGTEGVPVNQVIALLLEAGEAASALDDAAAKPAEAAPAAPDTSPDSGTAADVSPLARRIAEQGGIDIATLSGTGAHGRVVRADVEAAISARGNGSSPVAAKPTMSDSARIFISPIAARMAAQAGLDLAGISGTGTGGRIVRADVEMALAGGPVPASLPIPAPATAPVPESDGEGYTTVPLSTMGKVIAERMAFAKQTVPHFYLSMDCEIDELLSERKILNQRDAELRLSINDFIIRAVALALMEVPTANVSWDDGHKRQYRGADISVAVAIEGGLITPIVRGAEAKGLGRISADMKDLAARARDGKLTPDEYQGGSFTISNLGMFGVKQFDAVINTPQACILAVGAGEKRPVVKEGELAVATVMTLTLSCDHRVVDGATGAKLLGAIKRLLEYPPAMLL
jgi:pyruvate dehydrogenase E2 component (dihydrolipoamide acetyltransferase)